MAQLQISVEDVAQRARAILSVRLPGGSGSVPHSMAKAVITAFEAEGSPYLCPPEMEAGKAQRERLQKSALRRLTKSEADPDRYTAHMSGMTEALKAIETARSQLTSER